ncbi:hypothetical protein [Photobacterium damselae]|uniref:hypothetical protein n=1 Tax=Photobacterium damselae TaxID=38293 RepID=UPI00406862D7
MSCMCKRRFEFFGLVGLFSIISLIIGYFIITIACSDISRGDSKRLDKFLQANKDVQRVSALALDEGYSGMSCETQTEGKERTLICYLRRGDKIASGLSVATVGSIKKTLTVYKRTSHEAADKFWLNVEFKKYETPYVGIDAPYTQINKRSSGILQIKSAEDMLIGVFELYGLRFNTTPIDESQTAPAQKMDEYA